MVILHRSVVLTVESTFNQLANCVKRLVTLRKTVGKISCRLNHDNSSQPLPLLHDRLHVTGLLPLHVGPVERLVIWLINAGDGQCDKDKNSRPLGSIIGILLPASNSPTSDPIDPPMDK